LLIELLSLIGVSIIVLTVAAGIIGTVFGYFTARGLTRRLDNITQTTDAWGQGDFSAFIDDRSDDELGQLAQRFNRMAEQMQNLLQTRHELATVEERNRLARDLHDSVKQQVFAIAMQVGAARSLLDQDSTAALEHLNEAEQLSRQAQTELAAIIRELQPATLQGRGFAQALKEYVADWSRQNKIAAEVRMQGELSLPLEAERTLFRVFQEALSNIAWHSGATHIDVQLVCEINEVSLVIADNGKGFDITAVEGTGVGLRSMRERMEALDGSLSLESIPGQGTRLIARLLLTRGVPQ
jgi:NarL family two-component system sensor histidine kinase LiaS